MKQFLCVVAILCLATSGCTANRMIAPRGQRGGILTSQRAPRPNIQRNFQSEVVPAAYDGSCDVGCGACDPECGCDICCEPTCGEPYCDPECGCDVTCDPGCGVCDPCCTDTCTGDGCSSGSCSLFDRLLGRNGRKGNRSILGNGSSVLGNGSRNGGGMANGKVCSACGDPNCRGCLGGRAGAHALATGLCPHAGGYPEYPTFNPGPPTGQVAYPYYTTRGPRDFLMNNPPSIGPY